MNAPSHPGCLNHPRKEKNAVKCVAMLVYLCFGLVSTHPTSLSGTESFTAIVVNDRTLHGPRVDKVRPASTFHILQELCNAVDGILLHLSRGS
jgi:hypothetical protein